MHANTVQWKYVKHKRNPSENSRLQFIVLTHANTVGMDKFVLLGRVFAHTYQLIGKKQ